MRVAIIPARKGSARAPRKNVAVVDGLDLTQRTIRQALRVCLYDKVIVSTNDPEVISIAERYPVEVDIREESLSDSFTPVVRVIAHLIQKYDIALDKEVSLLHVTNPLRTDNDIRAAHEKYLKHNGERAVVSVSELDYPVEMAFKMDKSGHLKPMFENQTTRKQDFTTSFRWNDAIIVDAAKRWSLKDRKLFGEFPLPYVMPPERSFCIDYPWQLRIVKLLMENTNHDQNT